MDVSKIGELSELAQLINAETDLVILVNTDGSYTWNYGCIESGHFRSEPEAIIAFIRWAIKSVKEDIDADYDDGLDYEYDLLNDTGEDVTLEF